jgi:hypothetical protein
VAIAFLGLAFLGRLFTDDGSVPVLDDEEQQVETVGSLVTSPPRYSRPIVKVDQGADVVDGQIVEVAGSGFAKDAEVEIRQCAGDLGCTRLEPVETTGEVGAYRTSFHTDELGTFRARVAVRRFMVGPRGEPPVDCSAGTGGDLCTLSMAVYFTGRSQYPNPVVLHFTDGDGARQRPTVVADATSGLVDGQIVRLVGLGFTPGATVKPVLCPTNPGPDCVDVDPVAPIAPVQADATVEAEVRIPMRAGDLDCLQTRACTINLSPEVSGGFPIPAPLPVSFAAP